MQRRVLSDGEGEREREDERFGKGAAACTILPPTRSDKALYSQARRAAVYEVDLLYICRHVQTCGRIIVYIMRDLMCVCGIYGKRDGRCVSG